MLVLVGRSVLVLLLYAAAVFLGILSLGAGISTPGDAAQASRLMLQADLLLTGAAAAGWAAGLLWIWPVVDAIAERRAPASVFLGLAIIFAVPQLLLSVLDETRVLSDLRLVTWLLTPPAAAIALIRFVSARLSQGPREA